MKRMTLADYQRELNRGLAAEVRYLRRLFVRLNIDKPKRRRR